MAKKNINLLPPDEQKQNRIADINVEVRNFGFWIGLSLVILAGFFAVNEIILLRELDANAEEISTKNAELAELKKTPLRQQMESLNLDLRNFFVLSTAEVYWSNALIELASALPADVTLDHLKLDKKLSRIEIDGHSSTRNSVLVLRENILASPYFRNINFPLANLEKEKNLNWKYRFYVNPEAFK